MPVTKIELIGLLRDGLNCRRDEALSLLEALLETMKSTLESGEDILISGFGKFKILKKSERLGRNPSIGETVMLRPRKIIKFKPSANLRRKMNS
jgi:integration host factor subunit alpha